MHSNVCIMFKSSPAFKKGFKTNMFNYHTYACFDLFLCGWASSTIYNSSQIMYIITFCKSLIVKTTRILTTISNKERFSGNTKAEASIFFENHKLNYHYIYSDICSRLISQHSRIEGRS